MRNKLALIIDKHVCSCVDWSDCLEAADEIIKKFELKELKDLNPIEEKVWVTLDTQNHPDIENFDKLSKTNKFTRKIKNMNTNIIHNSITQAAVDENISQSTIYRGLKDNRYEYI